MRKTTDMQLQPILASLRHHRLTAFLLILQVAFTCAIVCNVVFMIANRAGRVMLSTGVVENELSMVEVTGIDKHENPQVRHATDLAALRAVPGALRRQRWIRCRWALTNPATVCAPILNRWTRR